ncbi:nucleotidyl transferase AbiEii/AbiGii toxin family protein [Promicromonospora soli]|uniref:Nucleotidyltransferase AbiEii toxin of type IV toxin-antitoxin system n=1 Tax=Promicromonospora soli TaxID=2035533 RepID=A0A919FRA6_9MICO|nr:hypothetical protein GCM10017772_16700 [Promicromonospora soli]
MAAVRTGRPAKGLLREFVYERLLARVFAEPDEPWVLKGGTALLARADDARHSKDVDLRASLQDIDDAVDALPVALARDLDDFFSFDIRSTRPTPGDDQQPGIEGRTLTVVPRVGIKPLEPFKIDLVTGSLMTASPDRRPAPALGSRLARPRTGTGGARTSRPGARLRHMDLASAYVLVMPLQFRAPRHLRRQHRAARRLAPVRAGRLPRSALPGRGECVRKEVCVQGRHRTTAGLRILVEALRHGSGDARVEPEEPVDAVRTVATDSRGLVRALAGATRLKAERS